MEEIKKIRKGMTKANKGITLIALVITIIILIILAGVAVNLSLGENGIFNRAKTAREQYKMAEVKEKIELAIVDIQSEKMGKGEQCTIDTIISELPGKVDGLTISKDGENAKGKYNDCDFTIDPSLKLTIEGYTPSTGGGTSGGTGGSTGGGSTPTTTLVDSITLNKTSLTLMESKEETLTATISPTNATNKEVTWSTNADSIATVDTTGKVKAVATGTAIITATAKDGSGKSASCTVTVESAIKAGYVNYGIDLNGNGDTTDDWKIFYKEDDETSPNNGNTYIIAANYLDVTRYSTVSVNAGMTKYSTYRAYWRTVPAYTTITDTVRSRFMFSWNKNTTNNNIKPVSKLLDTSLWSSFVTTELASKGGTAIGGPTAEMWVASWNKAYPTSTQLTLNANNTNGYQINGDYSISLGGTPGYRSAPNVYFPDPLADNAYGYWLASPASTNTNDVLYVYYNGSLTCNNSNYDMFGLRPLVCLPSGVSLTPSGTENLWNIKYN